MSKRHWHVVVGMGGGYMPDTAEYHATKRDALASAAEHVAGIVDDEEYNDQNLTPRRHKSGNLRRDGIVTFSRGGHDLGYYVEVTDCTDDCEDESDGY